MIAVDTNRLVRLLIEHTRQRSCRRRTGNLIICKACVGCISEAPYTINWMTASALSTLRLLHHTKLAFPNFSQNQINPLKSLFFFWIFLVYLHHNNLNVLVLVSHDRCRYNLNILN